MAHNGIVHGLMQAYTKKFPLLDAKADRIEDAAEVAELWQNSRVIRSWLLDRIAAALARRLETGYADP